MGKHSFYDPDTGEKVFGRASRMPAMIYGPPPAPVYSDVYYVRKAVETVWSRTFEKYGSSPNTGTRGGVRFSEAPQVPLEVQDGEIIPAWYWKDEEGHTPLSKLICKAKKLYGNSQKREAINAFRNNHKICVQITGSAFLWGVTVSGDIALFDLVSARSLQLNSEYALNIESYSRLDGRAFSQWHCQDPGRYPVDFESLKALFKGFEEWMVNEQPSDFIIS